MTGYKKSTLERWGLSEIKVGRGTAMAEHQSWMSVTFRPSGSSALKTDLILRAEVFFRGGLAYFSRTKLNHILQLFQPHGFVVEEFTCWTDLLQSRCFTT